MSVHFNADEVLLLAERIERHGRDFYERAARLVGDGEVSRKLLDLARMEAEHESVFATVRILLLPDERAAPTYDPNGQTPAYLSDMATRHVFANHEPAELLKYCHTAKEVLDLAIRFERDSMELFAGLVDFVPESLGKNKVQLLVDEELEHMEMLVSEKDRIAAVAQESPAGVAG